ncbi:hypothetical protein [Carnobacterium inhibens]|uniref:Lipoprotein n=1 Tax=Carnobacterium inhibens TaxID=147709 RepID=A0ABR7TDI5_9LACT|nr:hypothetical protein [Carnobacterium inhibens]MBC9825504.1 hypothetical protein [Carnobacterium inhibens]
MKKQSFLGYLTLFFLLTGCSTLSETEAEKIVIEEYSNHLGEATILSTEKKGNDYYIEWENKNNKSRGESKISTDGKEIIIEAEIE